MDVSSHHPARERGKDGERERGREGERERGKEEGDTDSSSNGNAFSELQINVAKITTSEYLNTQSLDV